eukprot:m.334568 g.334568  ORF g.334568 m.334568 type:complete len:320 (+) comp17385_c0_seq1:317-1276(+)
MASGGRQKSMRQGDFMAKPEEGWAHNTAALAVGHGVYYSFPVRYIGSIQILETMRDLSMEDKTGVCWEAIARCCDAAKLRKTKKRKVSKVVKRFLADQPYIKEMELKINLSVEGIATSDLSSNEIISNDDIKKISFAAGGNQSEYDFVTYVAKDKRENRYCHVFDCKLLADDVLATIGQIFNILTNKAADDLESDIKAVQNAPKVDNPLYHAMATGQVKGRSESAAVNAGYDEGDGAMYDSASPSYGAIEEEDAYAIDEEKGQEFAKFLNENVASQPLYGEVGEGDAIYGDGAEPGWGYLDVKPDEDLYGGLADVFQED